ncbi:MAG: Uncharacterised protein [Opitutia bacterium UBA7350]|nr:MAG: Uncharacterised protein [Opitutae bacterium UBA7350]
MLLRLLFSAAALLGTLANVHAAEILVRSWAQDNYERSKSEDGTPLKESYIFFKGQHHPGSHLNDPEEGISFKEVTTILNQHLATRNYSLTSSPAVADLILVVHWGELTPEGDDFEDGIEASMDDGMSDDPNAFNMSGVSEAKQRSNAQIIGTTRMYEMHKYSLTRQLLEQAVKEDRYFINVIAFDRLELTQRKKNAPLPEPKWTTQLSVPSSRKLMDRDAFGILAKAGSSYFGENVKDLNFMRQDEKRGVVKVGELEFIESIPIEEYSD